MLKKLSQYNQKKISDFINVFMMHSGNGYVINVPKNMMLGTPYSNSRCK